jgi:hypothetical protein
MSLDLFGTAQSSTAHWAYVWGIKGRYDESPDKGQADKQNLNEAARGLYIQEISGLVAALNKEIPEGKPKLFIPSDKFQRGIGEFAGQPYSVTGELLSPEAYAKHLAEGPAGSRGRRGPEAAVRGEELHPARRTGGVGLTETTRPSTSSSAPTSTASRADRRRCWRSCSSRRPRAASKASR